MSAEKKMDSREEDRSAILVWDLDGTLIDSEVAVRMAYRQAGVDMPRDAWGKPWQDWLMDACAGDLTRAQQIHATKNRLYPDTLALHGRRLPGADALVVLRTMGYRCGVLTGASEAAAIVALATLDLADVPIIGTQASTQQKAEVLWILQDQRRVPVAYVDDDADAVRTITDAAPSVECIHYADRQHSKTLLIDRIHSWASTAQTPSSSQQDEDRA